MEATLWKYDWNNASPCESLGATCRALRRMRCRLGETFQVRRRTRVVPVECSANWHRSRQSRGHARRRAALRCVLDRGRPLPSDRGDRRTGNPRWRIRRRDSPRPVFESRRYMAAGFPRLAAQQRTRTAICSLFRNLCQRSDGNATRGIGYADSRSLEKLIGVRVSGTKVICGLKNRTIAKKMRRASFTIVFHRRRSSLCLFFVPGCTTTHAGEPPLKVLFIGNSYTYVNDLPSLIVSLPTLPVAERFRPINTWSAATRLSNRPTTRKPLPRFGNASGIWWCYKRIALPG